MPKVGGVAKGAHGCRYRKSAILMPKSLNSEDSLTINPTISRRIARPQQRSIRLQNRTMRSSWLRKIVDSMSLSPGLFHRHIAVFRHNFLPFAEHIVNKRLNLRFQRFFNQQQQWTG